MTTHALVSYDDTPNDRDALALAALLQEAGVRLTLAYVRHATHSRRDRERLAEHEAEALLERGAASLRDAEIDRRVVISPSTGEGLRRLAAEIDADLIVFGSEYRTGAGHVSIGRSAEMLLENGRAAIALAPAAYAAVPGVRPARIGVLPGTAEEAAVETARALAERLETEAVDSARHVGLLVVGSRPEAREGHVLLTAAARRAIEQATAPVLVVPRSVALRFEERLVTA